MVNTARPETPLIAAINFGDDSFMRTKSQTPTLAQNARMGAPKLQTQNFYTRNSTPNFNTQKNLNTPNFNIQNLGTSNFLTKTGNQNHKEVCV